MFKVCRSEIMFLKWLRDTPENVIDGLLKQMCGLGDPENMDHKNQVLMIRHLRAINQDKGGIWIDDRELYSKYGGGWEDGTAEVFTNRRDVRPLKWNEGSNPANRERYKDKGSGVPIGYKSGR